MDHYVSIFTTIKRLWKEIYMAETTKIDERQSATWAQEITLKALLAESASSNSILESFLKVSGKLSAEQIAEMEKSRTEAKKSSDDASKSFGKIKPNIDMSLKDAFGDLRVSLRESVDTIKSGFKSGDVSSVMSGLSSQAKNAGTSMMEWSKAQPAAMRSLSMFAGGLTLYAGVAMAMWGTMTQLNAEFGKMYETGINFTGGLQGMATAAGNMGLSTAELSSTFTQFGAAVTSLGVDRAAKLGSEFTKLNRETGNLGLTNQQAVEAMLEYSEMMRSTGMLSKMSNEELTKGAAAYYTELNQIAAVTGRNRKEIEKSIAANAKNLDFQVVLRSMPEEMRKNVLKSAQGFQKYGQEGAEALTKTMTGFLAGRGVAGLAPELRNAFTQTGLTSTLDNMAAKMKRGEDIGDELDLMAEKFQDPNIYKSFEQFAGMPGPAGDMVRQITKLANGSQNLADSNAALAKEAEKETGQKKGNAAYDAAYERLKKKRDDATAAANARQIQADEAMKAVTQTLSNMFKVLAVDLLEPMLPVIELFAWSIESIAGLFKGLADILKTAFSWILPATKDAKTGQVTGGAASTAGNLTATALAGGAGYMGYKYLKGRFSGGGAADIAEAATSKTSKVAESAEKIKGGKSGGILRSISNGIASFGRPQVLLGVAAIGGLAATFYGFAKAIEVFNNISWEGMGKAGVAMIAFGAAIGVLTLAAGPLAVAGPLVATGLTAMAVGVGALGIALLPVAASIGIVAAGAGVLADGLGAFGKGVGATFEGMGSMVGKATEGIGKGVGAVTDSFANMRKTGIEATTDQIERLSKLPSENMLSSAKGIEAMKVALDGFQPGIMSGVSNFFGNLFSSDPTAQLSKLAGLGDGLTKTVTGMNGFASAFDTVVNILNSRTLSANAEKTFDQIKNMLGTDMGGMFGGSPKIIGQVSGLADSIAKLADSAAKLQSNTSANTTAPTAGGISTDILNKRTMQHYDDVRSANDSMINLLQGLNEKLDQLDRTTRDSSNTLSRSISKASPNLM